MFKLGTSLRSRVRTNNLAYYLFYLIGAISASLVLVIGIGLLIKSYPIIESHGFFNSIFSIDWYPLKSKFGLLPFLVSSCYVSLLALIISVPVCLLTAIYLIEYASKKVLNLFFPIIDILAGLPSVALGVEFAAVGRNLDIFQKVAVVDVEDGAVRHRAGQVGAKAAVGGHHQFQSAEASGVVKAHRVVI